MMHQHLSLARSWLGLHTFSCSLSAIIGIVALTWVACISSWWLTVVYDTILLSISCFVHENIIRTTDYSLSHTWIRSSNPDCLDLFHFSLHFLPFIAVISWKRNVRFDILWHNALFYSVFLEALVDTKWGTLRRLVCSFIWYTLFCTITSLWLQIIM